MARKPFLGTVAANVAKWGVGGLHIDACRVDPTGERLGGGDESGKAAKPEGWARPWMDDPDHVATHNAKVTANVDKASQLGRWPANLIHDGSPSVVALFPADAGASSRVKGTEPTANGFSGPVAYSGMMGRTEGAFHDDSGSAARFFYCAKTSRRDRHEGLESPGPQFERGTTLRKVQSTDTKGNNHPTVKPTELMAYLLRLVTPVGGIALDPFMGSGSTGKAAMLEGFGFIGIEQDAAYMAIAEARIKHAKAKSQMQQAEQHLQEQQLNLFSA
jgi:site-specific DNA-methyltransferase (adenine-specific)